MSLHGFFNMIGFSRHTADYPEKVISAVGGFLGIFGILLISQWLLGPDVAVMIVPSMGASAVLLFAAPHAPFSQPWNVIGGHSLSAIIGVACWQWIPDFTVAASASVELLVKPSDVQVSLELFSITVQPSIPASVSSEIGGVDSVAKSNEPIGNEPIGNEPSGKEPSGVELMLSEGFALCNASTRSARLSVSGLVIPSPAQVLSPLASACSS